MTNSTIRSGSGYRGDNYRVVHASDPTPHTVYYDKFFHVAPEYWIRAPGSTNDPSKVQHFPASWNANGNVVEEPNGSWPLTADMSYVSQHGQYIRVLYYTDSEC
jgi:hypothetical protein